MFWRRVCVSYHALNLLNSAPVPFTSPASGIDALLDRSSGGEDVSLEAILDDDDLLNECKAQNTRLIEYLQRIDVLRRLLGYACGQIEGEGLGRYRYPHVATEVLCSEIWSIVETCVREADHLLVPFWDTTLSMSNAELQQKPLIGPHFTKITTVFMAKKPDDMFAFIRSQSDVLDRILTHIEIPAFVDLVFRLIQLEELPGAGGVIEWLSYEGLIPKLASMLSPSYPPDLHTIVSDMLKGIIALCAPSPGNANDQIALVANRFSRQLASQEIATLLVGYMLDDIATTAAGASSKSPPNATSGANPSPSVPQGALQTHEIKVTEDDDARSVSSASSSSSRSEYHSIISSPSERSTSSLIHVASVIIELMRKNNSDFFEPYLFHTIRQRLIHIQQQYLPQLERPGMDAERRAEDDRLIFERAMADMTDQMGIVNFGPLLSTLTARLPQFQALLQNPRSLTGPMQTTVGKIIPLTVERFRICELYAELLHCSSLSLLNRPHRYGPVYDRVGRLTGGLAGLEELARVISANGSEPQEPDTPPAPSLQSFTQDTESPVVSRGTLSSSLASVDGNSDSQSGSEANSDDLGHLEEIDVHDESPIELRIPHSPQPSREPLPPAPFAVPSPRSQPPQLPDVSEDAEGTHPASSPPGDEPSSPASTSTALPSTSSYPETAADTDTTDIDPFADPNDSPTDPQPPLSASVISTTALEDTRLLREALEESTAPSMWDAPKPEFLAPPGELFKDQMLSLGILNTMLDLFFGFPMNNFLHNVVYDLLHQLMTGQVDKPHNRELVISLFRDAKLIHRIIEAQALCDVVTSQKKGVRLAYMGHLTLISEDVISALALYPTELSETLAQYCPQPQWDAYVSGRFKETKDRDSSQLGGGKPILTAMRSAIGSEAIPGPSARGAAGLNVDEAERLPSPSGVSSSNGRSPVQNVLFSGRNLDEEQGDPRTRNSRSSPQSEEFSNYLSQQINGSSNGRFASPSSSDGSDDEDDVKWFDDVGGGFPTTGHTRAPRRSEHAATFDDDFGGYGTAPSISLKDDDDFEPFEDSQLAEAAQNNFTSDFSDEFSFPPSSSSGTGSSSLFDLDDRITNAPTASSAGFSFGNALADDDDFGEFQGVGLEVVVSTKADGTMVSSTFADDDPFAPSVSANGDILHFSTSSHGSTEQSPTTGSDSDQVMASRDGDVTPRAITALFDNNFGSPLPESTDTQAPLTDDPDLFSFQTHRASPPKNPDGENSSNVSNALSLLEKSFGRVTVAEEEQQAIERGLSEAMSSDTAHLSARLHDQ